MIQIIIPKITKKVTLKINKASKNLYFLKIIYLT